MRLFKIFLITLLAFIYVNRLSANGLFLEADTVVVLSEINILENSRIGTQINTTGSINRLSATEIDNISGINPASYLNTIPGVQLQSGTLSTNRLTIRGIGSRTPYNTNRINLFLLNIPITSNDGVSAPEEILSLQNLDLSIQKGPSSALMGSGLGGTVKIIPSLSATKNTYLSSSLSSFNTVQFSVGHRNRDKTFIAANFMNSDGYRENNKYRRYQLLANRNVEFENIKLQAILYFFKGSAQIPSSLSLEDFENSPSKAAANWLAIEGYEASTKAIAGLNLEHKISTQLKGITTIFSKYYDGHEKRPFNTLNDQLNSLGASYQLNYSGEVLQSIILARGSTEKYSWDILKDEILQNEFVQNLAYFSFSNISYFKVSERLNLSVANAINIHNYQYKNRKDLNFEKKQFPLIYSPRLGINYALKKNSFWASVGHGYSNPSPEEALYPDGEINNNLKQETGWQYEVGHRFNNLRATFSIESAIYYFNLNNLIVTKRLTEDQFMGINAGKTKHFGIENSVSWLLFSINTFPGQLMLKSTISVSKNSFVDFENNGVSYNGKNLPSIPDYQFSNHASWMPTQTFSINITNSNTGQQFLNDSNTLKSNSFSILNLNVKYKFQLRNQSSIHLKFGINNLRNEHYAGMIVPNAIGFNGAQARYYYPGIPRNYYLNLTFSF